MEFAKELFGPTLGAVVNIVAAIGIVFFISSVIYLGIKEYANV